LVEQAGAGRRGGMPAMFDPRVFAARASKGIIDRVKEVDFP